MNVIAVVWRACLNKLINTYLNHWPLILPRRGKTIAKAAFVALCFKPYANRTNPVVAGLQSSRKHTRPNSMKNS